MFIAGIVLYNPDIQRLRENIDSVKNQISKIVFVDNGSVNISEIEELLSEYSDVELIKNSENYGIAKALNQTLEYASANKYDWILSMDQDSILMSGIIEKYKEYVKFDDIAVITGVINDRNAGLIDQMDSDAVEVDLCITSGAVYRVSAMKEVGGYDEKMFIDYVDFDMCLTLKKNGYRIMKVNYISLLHEVGNTKIVKFFGKEEYVYNESAFRKYYEVRNRLYYAQKHKDVISKPKEHIRLFKFVLLTLLYEKNRCEKIKRMLKGLHDYKLM